MVWQIRQLNQRVFRLLQGLIMFKKQILEEVVSCRLYTANYPLLLQHIIREAELYQQTVSMLEERKCVSTENIMETELFWNQIMMEHALFIRGLLDPTECELAETADTFAGDYCRLLEEARNQDCRAIKGLTRNTGILKLRGQKGLRNAIYALLSFPFWRIMCFGKRIIICGF